MARPRVGGTVHAGAGVWRVHTADGSPMLGGPATLRTAARGPPGRFGKRRARRLLRPVRVLDNVHEVGPLVAGDESLEHVRLDVAERRFRLGRDAFGERL